MERYRLFYEGGENIPHGNRSVLPIMHSTLFAFALPENFENSICVLENMGEGNILHRLKKGWDLILIRIEILMLSWDEWGEWERGGPQSNTTNT